MALILQDNRKVYCGCKLWADNDGVTKAAQLEIPRHHYSTCFFNVVVIDVQPLDVFGILEW